MTAWPEVIRHLRTAEAEVRKARQLALRSAAPKRLVQSLQYSEGRLSGDAFICEQEQERQRKGRR